MSKEKLYIIYNNNYYEAVFKRHCIGYSVYATRKGDLTIGTYNTSYHIFKNKWDAIRFQYKRILRSRQSLFYHPKRLPYTEDYITRIMHTRYPEDLV